MNAREWLGAIGSSASVMLALSLFCFTTANPLTVTLMVLSICGLFLSPMLYA